MSYVGRHRHARHRGHRQALGQPSGFQPGIFGLPGHPDIAFGVPGPGSPGIPAGASPITQPAGLFPTNVKWGDVVNVTGPFAGAFQGQVLVRFAGVPAQAVAIMGPFGGSVVVPDGAETGACQIELNGRTIYGTNCVVSKGLSGGPPPARAGEHLPAWKNVGEGTQLLGDHMTYVPERGRRQGVGAIDAQLDARDDHRRGGGGGGGPDRDDPDVDPILFRPRKAVTSRPPRTVYPGVRVVSLTQTRAGAIVSGLRPGQPPAITGRPGTTPQPRPTSAPTTRPPRNGSITGGQIGTGIGTPSGGKPPGAGISVFSPSGGSVRPITGEPSDTEAEEAAAPEATTAPAPAAAPPKPIPWMWVGGVALVLYFLTRKG